MTRTAAALAILLLTACARSEEASMVPADANQALQKVETVRPDRDDGEIALGTWREALQDDQRALEFGPTGAPALFSLRCDARRLLLQRHGPPPAGELPVMRVQVGGETRQLAVTAGAGANPMLRAALAAGDPLLAALGRSGAPLSIRVGDTAALNLPPSPLVATYATQCAGGQAEEVAGNSAAPANQAADAGD